MEICGKDVRISGRLIRIAHLDGEGYQFFDDPLTAIENLRDCGERVDIFTFVQRISETTAKYDFPMEWDNFAALSVTTFEHWMGKQVSSRVRGVVRKSSKEGVVTKEVPLDEPLLLGISAIYNECPIRQGRRFPHYGVDFESLRKMKSTYLDQSIFIGAYFQDELIGFIKLVMDEARTQAGTMHILSMMRHRDKAPTNALIAQAVRSCAAREIPILWYVKYCYGKKRDDSLAEFKRRNGFQKVEVPRYYVPLSTVGRAALRLGLHHRMVDMVPEPIAATYRALRTRWFARRHSSFESA